MLHIPIVHAHDVSKQIPREKNEKLINTIELKSFHVRQDRPQCFLVARQRLQVKAI